mgnify:CR=1 FL=1
MATPTVERYAVSGQMVLEDDAPDRADALAARFRDGDPRALEEVYREHGTLVHSFCRRSLGDTRAADATQEVFLAAWRSRERYRPDAGTLAGWLMGIARFKVIDAHRAEQRQPLTVDLTGPVEPVAGSGDLDQMAQRMLLADALETLPERSRQMVRHAFFEDLTHTQIAERYGIPLGTVKSDIRRGVEKLRRHLEAFDDAPRS